MSTARTTKRQLRYVTAMIDKKKDNDGDDNDDSGDERDTPTTSLVYQSFIVIIIIIITPHTHTHTHICPSSGVELFARADDGGVVVVVKPQRTPRATRPHHQSHLPSVVSSSSSVVCGVVVWVLWLLSLSLRVRKRREHCNELRGAAGRGEQRGGSINRPVLLPL